MFPRSPITRARRWLATALLLAASSLAHAQLEVRMSSQFLVKGEQAILEYVVEGALNPRARLTIPEVPNLSIRPVGYGAEPRMSFGRRREFVFSYAVTSYEPGTYTIPPAVLDSDGATTSSAPVKVRIYHETDLEWSTVDVGGTNMRYAAAFRTIDDQPFVKEVLPTELKIYLPANQRVEDWGIPEFERDGIAAWRFEPRPSLGRANLLGTSYYAVSYPSTLSPTRSGEVRLGPAKLRLMTVQTSVRDFGSAFYAPANLVISPLTLNARDLPGGAPEGFKDAVGKFELSVTASETEVREGDPVNVNIIVSGAGNLDTMDPPQPIDSEGWKLYPPSSVQLGERRAIQGAASFRQFMRPLRPQNAIPPFRLVYFDPETEEYVRLLSNSIPLKMLPSTNPAPGHRAVPMALPMPVEEMTDILGLVNTGAKLLPAGTDGLIAKWWQLIPAAIAVILFFRMLQLHWFPRFHKDPDEVARMRELRKLDRAPSDARGFYRATGHFVERWLGDREDPVTRDILAKRDQTCFTEEVEGESVSRSERQRVLRGLRKLALPVLVLLACLSPTLRAEDMPATEPADGEPDALAAYEQGSYGEAARIWLESGPYDRLPADTLYNIGNATYRLGVPGEAALYWRRALSRDETHAEARQNLRFFERKFGSIAIKRPDYQYTLAKLPLVAWKNFVWAGAWMLGLGLLVFPATRYGSRLRIVAIAAMVTSPLLTGAGICGWYYYPDDARFAPLAEQAVITADRASVRTDAARNAPLVIEAPAGSLCRVVSERGEWSYIAFTNDTRGWLQTSRIGKLIPEGDPVPPAIPAPTEDDKSA
ncbi:BatD family protein [Haloferula helveola]